MKYKHFYDLGRSLTIREILREIGCDFKQLKEEDLDKIEVRTSSGIEPWTYEKYETLTIECPEELIEKWKK